jgi:hypothetical protein
MVMKWVKEDRLQEDLVERIRRRVLDEECWKRRAAS